METPRKFIVAGNWKMNGTRSSTQSLLSSLTSASLDPSIEVIIAPSALHLTLVRSLLPPSTTTTPIALAAQNVSDRPNGAFTGEISVAQLKDLGVAWALVGHSERRTVMGEGDGLVGKKVKALLEGGLGAILCCGESLGERERGETVGVVTRQLMAVRDVLGEGKGWEGIVVAYEPIWAIGTGKVATTEVSCFLGLLWSEMRGYYGAGTDLYVCVCDSSKRKMLMLPSGAG